MNIITKIKNYRYKKATALLVIVLSLIISFLSLNATINRQAKEIELLQFQLTEKLAEKDEVIDSLQVKLNSRNWTDHYTKELLIKLVDNNRQAYYVRNEIMYYNKDMSREEASYQALWIYAWSIENNVHPYLTTAVFVQESKLRHVNENGNITTSHKGARGIGQLMPVIERIYNIDAAIFEENVKGTTLFLKDLHNMYSGDLEGMLGHYNGGSRPYEKIKDYEETRNFVETVSYIYECMFKKY